VLYGEAKRYSERDKVLNPLTMLRIFAHILCTLFLLNPNGLLKAICLNGPRQQKIINPLCDVWEELPRGRFHISMCRRQ